MGRRGAKTMGALATGLALAAGLLPATPASACGGFFCGRVPVDQSAERILFKVDEDSTTMVVQIAYTGAAPDFAWVLPLADVPAEDSLDTFPQRALTVLDANTGPQFQMPAECQRWVFAAAEDGAGGTPQRGSAGTDDEVTVHIEAEVGPYGVAVIESEDPSALVDWLRDNDFRVTDAMVPYIDVYTREGMKLLALKLQPEQDVEDIEPFQFTLPGTTPSIPLRMTALAAEPEMGILVWVLGEQRHAGANWPNIEIDDADIRWQMDTWPIQTNWTSLVAQEVDAMGGKGWVTELAEPTDDLVELLQNTFNATPEDQEAGEALLDLMVDAPYITRLYTRLSAEEMQEDPVFRPDSGGDVDNLRQLSRHVDGEDMCPDMPVSLDPCDFATCGAGGLCRPVMAEDGETRVAGCACVQGATARTTFAPNGEPTVICQDVRMSFVNPGDMDEASGQVLPDPCLGYDCGAHGSCVAMNMTPTCQCDEGYVAVGGVDDEGMRTSRCVQPEVAVPDGFGMQRLPDLPEAMPAGRETEVSMALPVVEPGARTFAGEGSEPGSAATGGACSLAAGRTGAANALLWLAAVVWLARRRRAN